MSIVWDWTDDPVEMLDLRKAKCALSGKPANPPFLYWMDAEILVINAEAFQQGSPGARGIGFMLDFVQLIHIAEHLSRGVSVGKIRDMAVNRLKGGAL